MFILVGFRGESYTYARIVSQFLLEKEDSPAGSKWLRDLLVGHMKRSGLRLTY